ncbi:MAG: sialate O-acetylesterase [Saprospiraceae bacterium]|nr:sialate O-acetylesterase [Saprospiraceae bacterium]
MKCYLFFLVLLLPIIITCQEEPDPRTRYFPRNRETVKELPAKDRFWIFILAGQSNMAGRGQVEPPDTIDNNRILSVNEKHQWIYAKEPLHYYEPNLTGLDCGMSFANNLLDHIPSDVTVGILPCAIGGSSVEQWLGDSLYRGVRLFSNFKEKADLAGKSGIIKGLLWHQGESNSKPELIPTYKEKLVHLLTAFRTYISNDSLPVVAGQLGAYTEPEERQKRWNSINSIIREIAAEDPFVGVIETKDLTEKGDKVHFDSKSQRTMGERFADEIAEMLN